MQCTIKLWQTTRKEMEMFMLAGRGGTCELMIGCIAKATSNALHMDESEMDDVRWVSRDQLQKAVEDSKRKDTPYQGL